MGRCKATNLCTYCARLAAVENTELLTQDALLGIAPVVWLVLSTGTDDLDPATFYAARKHLVKALRREFPDRSIEWAALVEFTTGYSKQSGGRRFPHWNVLLKGVGEDDMPRIKAVVDRVWCGRPEFKALPKGQHVGTVYSAGGLMRYLALHFQKESQSPPKGWRGHRFLKSRGYLWTNTPDAREHARDALRKRRELYKLQREEVVTSDGRVELLADLLEPEELWEMAERAAYEASELGWALVRLVDLPNGFTEDGEPTGFTTTPLPVC